MTGVVAYIALVAVVSAILCCHHGEDGRSVARAALRAFRRRRPGTTWARNRYRARLYAHRTRPETP